MGYPYKTGASEDDEPSFAIVAAKSLGGGIIRLALEPLGLKPGAGDFSSLRQGEIPAVKWICLRKEYLFTLDGGEGIDALFSDSEGAVSFPVLLKNDEAMSLFRSARAFDAERVAASYLFRAEHSRFQLERKLIKKGFSAKETAPALDFLEAEKTLDDRRFALAWLNTRFSLHPEGRAALVAALFERGVSREDADAAIAAFFEEHDEEELCRMACAKLMRRGRTGKKLISSLCRSGFPLSLALRVAGES